MLCRLEAVATSTDAKSVLLLSFSCFIHFFSVLVCCFREPSLFGFIVCVQGNPCDALGDATALCTDVPAPGVGNTCDCADGFGDYNGVCINNGQHTLFQPLHPPLPLSNSSVGRAGSRVFLALSFSFIC